MEFFLTLIIIFIVVFWLLGKFLPRLLVWYMGRKFGANSTGTRGFTGGRAEEPVGREGDVTVSKIEEKEKVIEKEMGEYIDFEEEKNN